jgi:hypothetical protein
MHEFNKGLFSGLFSSIVCSPFDLVKTRYQVSGTNASYISTIRQAYRKEGMGAFYNGFVGNVISVPIWWALYWPLYEEMKKHESLSKGTQAVIAGNIASLVSNPIFVLRTRIHNSTSTNYMTLFREMRRERAATFTKGYASTVIHNAQLYINMPLYEFLKENYTSDEDPWRIAKVALFSGFSKMVGGSLIYPIEVVRSRIRDLREPTSIKNIVLDPSFRPYAGYIPYLLRSVPSAASAFVMYEILRDY